MRLANKRIKIHGEYYNPQTAQIPDPETGKLSKEHYPIVFNEGYLIGVLVGKDIRVYLDPDVLRLKHPKGGYTIKELIEEHTDEDGNIGYVDLWDMLISDSEFGAHAQSWDIRLTAGDLGNLSSTPILIGPESRSYVDDPQGDKGDWAEYGVRKQPIGFDGFWLNNRAYAYLEAEDLIERGYVEYDWFACHEPHTLFTRTLGVDADALFCYHDVARRGEQNILNDDDAITNAIEFAGLTGDQVIDVEAELATQVLHVRETRIKYNGSEPLIPSHMAEKIVLRITDGNSVYKDVYRVIWASDGITWFGDSNEDSN